MKERVAKGGNELIALRQRVAGRTADTSSASGLGFRLLPRPPLPRFSWFRSKAAMIAEGTRRT